MSNIVSITGDDTTIIGGQLITSFGVGVVAELTYPEDIAKYTRGKNGNTVIALNNSGFLSELKIKILLGSVDDEYFNKQMALMKQAFSAYVLLNGVFIKNVGDGFGNIKPVTYLVSQGSPTKMPGAQSVAEGTPEQSQVEWNFKFSNSDRQVG